MTGKHAHEMEADGEVRWVAKLKDNLLMITDKSSGVEYQATAYTLDGSEIRFALPGDSGLRRLGAEQPGFEAFKKVIEKSPAKAESEKPSSKPANEKTLGT